jgi:hypothetical protein
MSQENENEFSDRPDTSTRLQDLTEKGPGYVVVLTRAFGPNGEDLIDHEGPRFSGEPGVKIHVKQGDKEEDIVLSPFFGDPSKVWTEEFDEGKRCELSVPETGAELDKIPGMTSEDGGEYYAIYLTDDLGEGELVAVNDMWGNYDSRVLSEGELLKAYADAGESEKYHREHDE